jgi:uncharacterized protein YjbI with pentapeptide repeats
MNRKELKKAAKAREEIEGKDLRHADMAWLNLTGATFRGCDMRGARLEGARLSGAVFDNCDLTHAEMWETRAHNAVFRNGTELRRAYLNNADLRFANFGGASLTGADLSGANLYGASLVDVDATGATFHTTQLTEANMSGADLREATLVGATLNSASLHDVKLSRGTSFGATGLGETSGLIWSQRGPIGAGPRSTLAVWQDGEIMHHAGCFHGTRGDYLNRIARGGWGWPADRQTELADALRVAIDECEADIRRWLEAIPARKGPEPDVALVDEQPRALPRFDLH